MGLLGKTNPKASRVSVLRAATISAIVGTIVFFACFKPMYQKAWPVALPIWVLLCAFVGALCEWQVPDEPAEDEQSNEDR